MSSFNQSKITGPYPFIAVFLIVVEFLLGYWLLFLANYLYERIIAGILVFGVFIAFVIIFVISEFVKLYFLDKARSNPK